MNAKMVAALMGISVFAAGPALGFKVVGDQTLPVLQTDDGQPFPGWDAAIGKCFAEARSKPSVGLNCNQSVTDALAQQDTNHQFKALAPDLADAVQSCITEFPPGALLTPSSSVFQRWEGWQSNFIACQKWVVERLNTQAIAAQQRFEAEARERRLQDMETVIVFLVGATAVLLALVRRRQISRAICGTLRSGFIGLLACFMRIGRARDQFIDKAVAEAKERLHPQGE